MLGQSLIKGHSFLVMPVAIGIIIPSLFVPWISTNVLGFIQYGPVETFFTLFGSGSETGNVGGLKTDLRSIVGSYGSVYLFAAGISLYVASIASMLFSIPCRSWRSMLSLAAGILAISSALVWVYSVELMKINFIQVTSITGGIIGEEFRGQERTLADAFFLIGSGHYLALLAGVISLLGFFINQEFEPFRKGK
ncbi:MAG TPA: hypothetical protein VLA68_05435, partial [Nitrososphaera sp.]|nr:hypothetical protein [Nitrososphaera sp.]